MIGVGYRPRSGTIFFTRNGKKLDDIAHGLKTQNFFPTVGANGPCTIHVNFGQMGFVFIEANVKKWGLAPMTGSLAPPPPYGSEQGSILLETGREGSNPLCEQGHSRTRSGIARMGLYPSSNPGPLRSATDISLAQLAHVPSQENAGEGGSNHTMSGNLEPRHVSLDTVEAQQAAPPPEYTSPEGSPRHSEDDDDEEASFLRSRAASQPPIPTYDAAVANDRPTDTPSDTHEN